MATLLMAFGLWSPQASRLVHIRWPTCYNPTGMRIERRILKQAVPPIAWSLAFLILVHAAWDSIPDHLPIHVDTSRHLAAVTDCLSGKGCLLRLSPRGGASVIGITHGALFLHFLALVGWLGGGVGTCLRVAALCTVSSVVGIAWMAGRLWGNVAAAAVVVAGLLGMTSGRPVLEMGLLWNPAMSSLPAALFLAGAICFIRSGRRVYLAIASFALSMGLQVHLSFLMLAPGLGFLCLLSARGQRSHSILLAVGIVACGVQLASPAMFLESIPHTARAALDLRAVGGDIPLPTAASIGVTGGSLLLLAWAWRSRKTHSGGLRLFLTFSYLPGLCVLALVQSSSARYYLPLAPGLVFLAAELIHGSITRLLERSEEPVRRILVASGSIAKVALPGCFMLLAFDSMRTDRHPTQFRPDSRDAFSFEQAEAAAAFLSSEGWTYEEVFRHLRTAPNLERGLSGLAVYMPVPSQSDSPRGPRSKRPDLALAMGPSEGWPHPLPERWTPIATGGGNALALFTYEPWLQWDRFSRCRSPVAVDSDCDPILTIDYRNVAGPLGPEFLSSRFPVGMKGLMGTCDPREAPLRIRVPLELRSDGVGRVLYIPRIEGLECDCVGQIERMEGITVPENLPSASATLHALESPRTGTVTIAWVPGALSCFSNSSTVPPSVLELRPEERDYLRRISEGENRSQTAGHTLAPTVQDAEISRPGRTSAGGMVENLSMRSDVGDPFAEPLAPRSYVLTVMLLLCVVTAAGILHCVFSMARGSGPGPQGSGLTDR